VSGLDLDFATGRYALNSPYSSTFPSGWSFSRTGAGTALDSSGNVIQFATGVPRITNRGLLVEEGRTNALAHSQDYSNAAWTKLNCTMLAGQSSPDGGNNAYKLQETTFNSAHLIFASMGAGTGATVMSVYLKAAERTWARVSEDSAGGKIAYINLTTGAVGTVAAGLTVLSVVAAPNGWWRVNILIASKSAGGNIAIGAALDNGVESYAGALNSGILIYQADVQAGSFPTSPIITTGAAATRGADLAGMSSLASLLNETSPYTILVDALWTPQATTAFAFEGAQVAGNITGATLGTNGTGRRSRLLHRSGANRSDGTEATDRTTGETTRMAITSGGRLAAFGGVIPSTATPAQSDWSPDGIRIGHRSDALGSSPSGFWNNYIRRIRILPYAASDAELVALTS
jgi:hypothetical protein